MTKGKSHISEDDLRRYLENEMTGNERNAFEKKLQKDPFATEALEGFETISLADFKKDLTELRGKIHPQKHRNRYRYLAAAATILLIVTAGVIWIQFNSENPVQEITQNSEAGSRKPEHKEIHNNEQVQMSEEIPAPQENTLTGKNESEIAELGDEVQIQAPAGSSNKQAETSIQKQESTNKQPDVDMQTQQVSRHESVPKTYELKTAQNVSFSKNSKALNVGGVQRETQTVEVSTENRTIRGKVISANDNQPLPGVTLIEKGTNNGIVTDIDGNFELELLNDSNPTVVASFVGMESAEFRPNQDSVYQIELESGDIALNEIVVVGSETLRKKSLTGSVSTVTKTSKNSLPEPVCGMQEYNKYLKKNAILPDDYPREKVMVKLLVKLDNDGRIISVENRNNTELDFFEKAKKLVFNGPGWNPEFKNGEDIASEVKLKIVFEKMN